ncbi:MAG: DNA repair protein RecO [Patescibacteria group bacterium]|jgi:DNA repair protein RecO (recombination protein O)
MNQKTLGIVIKRQDFSEADRILTIFTERFGKVKAMARGVRKISARLAGSLEPFMLVDLQLYPGRTFFTVTGASIKSDFSLIQTDIRKIANAFYVGELVDRFEKEELKSSEVFSLLVQSLQSLATTEDPLVLRVFEIGLLKQAGFWPELSHCRHCHVQLKPGNNFWDGLEGGIICSECQRLFRHGYAVSDNLIKFFRIIEEKGFGLIGHLNVESSLADEAAVLLSAYIRDILESNVKSERFLQNVSG